MSEQEVSRTLALAWGITVSPQRGPKRELTLEQIVEAAIKIADEEGLTAVTMQRVAQRFEFSTMALYRYVTTKDELHQLMLDSAFGLSEVPADSENWRDGLQSFLHSLVAGYRQHPWTLDIPLAPDLHLMPGQLRAADAGLRAMRTLSAPDGSKLAILMILSAFARGQAAVEREILTGEPTSAATRALIEEAVLPGDFPDAAALVRNGAYFGDGMAETSSAAEESEQALAFASEVLLAGLDVILQPSEAPASEPATLTPQESYQVAEADLQARIALRKRTQRRVQELEREEAALRKVRDRAKELAKQHAKQQRSGQDGSH